MDEVTGNTRFWMVRSKMRGAVQGNYIYIKKLRLENLVKKRPVENTGTILRIIKKCIFWGGGNGARERTIWTFGPNQAVSWHYTSCWLLLTVTKKPVRNVWYYSTTSWKHPITWLTTACSVKKEERKNMRNSLHTVVFCLVLPDVVSSNLSGLCQSRQGQRTHFWEM